jgi:hypothetical protein
MRRFVIPTLLLLEGARTALWIARLAPMLGAYSVTTTVVILLRGLTGALQIIAGWLGFEARLPARPLTMIGLLASAILTTLELGARLAPSDADPTFRWYFVAGYWVYALATIAYLSKDKS